MSKFKLALSLSIIALITSACGKMSATQQALNDANNGKFDKTEDRPVCEIQPVEYQLDTKMVSFELTNNFGVKAGFNLLTGFLKLLSVDFKAKSGAMTMNMSLRSPIAPDYELVGVLGKGTFWSWGAALDIGFDKVGGGFEFYHQTPLAKLAQKSLDGTFDNLTDEIRNLQDKWSTQVVAVPDEESVVIPAGTYNGIKPGDVFAIYNVDNIWSGTPCKSKFIMTRKNPAQPVAYGVATDVVKSASALTLLSDEGHPRQVGIKILKGAKIEAVKLVGNGRKLYRTLEIRSVTGAELSYDNGQSVDISPHLKDQINAIAHDYGFMIYAP